MTCWCWLLYQYSKRGTKWYLIRKLLNINCSIKSYQITNIVTNKRILNKLMIWNNYFRKKENSSVVLHDIIMISFIIYSFKVWMAIEFNQYKKNPCQWEFRSLRNENVSDATMWHLNEFKSKKIKIYVKTGLWLIISDRISH